jgi:hypothetical protein
MWFYDTYISVFPQKHSTKSLYSIYTHAYAFLMASKRENGALILSQELGFAAPSAEEIQNIKIEEGFVGGTVLWSHQSNNIDNISKACEIFDHEFYKILGSVMESSGLN